MAKGFFFICTKYVSILVQTFYLFTNFLISFYKVSPAHVPEVSCYNMLFWSIQSRLPTFLFSLWPVRFQIFDSSDLKTYLNLDEMVGA